VRSFDAGAPSTTTTASRHKTDRITGHRMSSIRTRRPVLRTTTTELRLQHDSVLSTMCVHDLFTAGRQQARWITVHGWNFATVSRYDDITGRAQNYAKFLSNRNLGYRSFSAFCASTANYEIKCTLPCCNAEHCKQHNSVNNDRKYSESRIQFTFDYGKIPMVGVSCPTPCLTPIPVAYGTRPWPLSQAWARK